MGLVFPLSYFQDKEKFDIIRGRQYLGLPKGLGYEEDFEGKSQAGVNIMLRIKN